jgi:hypothetical protein
VEASRGIDRIEVVFDDPNLVANAGLLVPLDWPWADPFTRALTNLRALRPAPT